MFITFSIQGEWINKLIFKSKLRSLGEVTLLGMIFQTIIVTILAFFYRIHVEYFVANVLFSSGLFIYCKKEWIKQCKRSLLLLKEKYFVVLFLVVVILSLVRSSLLPFIVDNEIYYLQSIKWLNEYGWVKGIANLDIYLSQTTPWHALQAGYNFNFITDIFNDINGFLICVAAYLWIEKIIGMKNEGDYKSNRWLFFVPVFSVFWFQFVDSPAADLPLFLIGLVIAYCLLNRSEERDLLVIFLSVFLVFIKLSIFPILVLMIFVVRKQNWKYFLSYSILLGGLYVAKGLWTSGCPFAPYTGFSVPLPWTIPDGLKIIADGDTFNFRVIAANSKIDVALFLLVVMTVFLYAILVIKKKEHRPLLLFLLFQFFFIVFTYAQFRYVLPALFFPATYLFSRMKIPAKILYGMVYVFIVLAFIPAFVKIDLGKLTENASLYKMDTFKVNNIVCPAGVTKYPHLQFTKQQCLNFDYYNPEDGTRYLFLTGNGPLPCVKTISLIYMHRKTGHLPMLIEEGNLGKGFVSTKVDFEKE